MGDNSNFTLDFQKMGDNSCFLKFKCNKNRIVLLSKVLQVRNHMKEVFLLWYDGDVCSIVYARPNTLI